MLDERWIEKIFQRLEDFYGAKWAAHYGDFPRARVMRTWAEELAGFSTMPEALGAALKAMSERTFPPTLPEFLAAAREAARRIDKSPRALEHKPSPEEIERTQQMAAKAAEATKTQPGYDHLEWARALKRRYLTGDKILAIQHEKASVALDEVWANGVCSSRGAL